MVIGLGVSLYLVLKRAVLKSVSLKPKKINDFTECVHSMRCLNSLFCGTSKIFALKVANITGMCESFFS